MRFTDASGRGGSQESGVIRSWRQFDAGLLQFGMQLMDQLQLLGFGLPPKKRQQLHLYTILHDTVVLFATLQLPLRGCASSASTQD